MDNCNLCWRLDNLTHIINHELNLCSICYDKYLFSVERASERISPIDSDYICSIGKEFRNGKEYPSVNFPRERCCQTCFHKSSSGSSYWRCEQCKMLYFGQGDQKLEGFVILEGRVYCFKCMINPKLPSALNYIKDVQISLPISDMPENGRYVDLS